MAGMAQRNHIKRVALFICCLWQATIATEKTCPDGGHCDVRAGIGRDHLLLQVAHEKAKHNLTMKEAASCTSCTPCTDSSVQRRRRDGNMCSCRRRSGFADNSWRCKDNNMVPAKPVWSDEFEDVNGDGSLNMSKWKYYLGPNHHNQEKQYYTDRKENAYVEGGVLKIVGKCENYGGMRYTSAYIKSENLGDFGPGHRVEVKAKLPWGKGTWPAIWMLPTDKAYGGWPDSGEIDIMEAVGCTPGTIYGTVHTGAYNHMKGTQKFGKGYLDFTQWHTYSIDWTENHMKWYVDGNHYHTFQTDINNNAKWPFDQRFFLILNLAIGGTWGGFCTSYPSCSRSSELKHHQVFEVDYVRVFCLDGSVSCTSPKFSCCNKCAGRAACSPRSKTCYDRKAKDYYESCDASLTQISENNAPEVRKYPEETENDLSTAMEVEPEETDENLSVAPEANEERREYPETLKAK
eukprot:TRINITY_DN8886_c0_g1_i1.p1 TRINITY_DN8886_c0_g1~~TRINITY_DN8886_c0_g1_i1.p1  ORF type:complete len:482 (-),score=79.60 TRINITY_DN8886_c0_g1_i1:103-1485(-)